jgi:hypothetical protein
MINVKVQKSESNFKDRFAKIAAGLQKNVELAVKSYAHEVTTNLFVQTPIDTAQARSNWVVTIGTADFNFVPLPDYRSRVGKGRPNVQAYSAAMRAAHAEIDNYKSGRVLFIQNNTPYIIHLDAGTSPQAQADYVNDICIAALKTLRDLRLIG